MRPTDAEIVMAARAMAALRFYPASDDAAVEIMRALRRMVGTKAQLDWLVRTMIEEVGEWHGVAELRGVFCSRFAPADGIEGECQRTGRFTGAALEARAILPKADSRALGAPGRVAGRLEAPRSQEEQEMRLRGLEDAK